MEVRNHEIPPETEFWGHCSNLQVWAENNYDTRILHSSLAFPLLNALVDAGDLIAKGVFKEEIVRRMATGNLTVVEYLIAEGFTDFLNKEELLFGILVLEEAELILELEKITGNEIHLVSRLEDDYSTDQAFSVKNYHILELDIAWSYSPPQELPNSLINLKEIKTLYYSGFYVKEIPRIITELKSLTKLDIFCDNLIKIPEEIKNLTSLKKLLIAGGIFPFLPDPVCSLTSLESLAVVGAKIEVIPKSIKNLKLLKSLTFKGNNIEMLTENIGKLKNLEDLNLMNNPIKKLPNSLRDISSLKELAISRKKNIENLLLITNNLKKKGVKILEF